MTFPQQFKRKWVLSIWADKTELFFPQKRKWEFYCQSWFTISCNCGTENFIACAIWFGCFGFFYTHKCRSAMFSRKKLCIFVSAHTINFLVAMTGANFLKFRHVKAGLKLPFLCCRFLVTSCYWILINNFWNLLCKIAWVQIKGMYFNKNEFHFRIPHHQEP